MSKHFISILGTSIYQPIRYGDEPNAYEFIQENLIKKYMLPLEDNDRITIFVTEDDKDKNGTILRGSRSKNYERADGSGLKRNLKELLNIAQNDESKLHVESISIGKSTSDLWDNFSIIFNSLKKNEELYVDVTHGFRSLPMIMLSVVTYAQSVLNVHVKAICYGAYEARQENEKGEVIAPVFDLLPFIDIIRWAQAANSFARFGNSDEIKALSDEIDEVNSPRDKIIEDLYAITHSLETSRGFCDLQRRNEFQTGQSVMASVQKFNNNVQSAHLDENNPINRLICDVIKNRLDETFDTSTDLKTGFGAIQWAIDNHKTQQGYTALQETIITYLCEQTTLINSHQLDYTYFDDREIVRKACIEIYNAREKLMVENAHNTHSISEVDLRRMAKSNYDRKQTNKINSSHGDNRRKARQDKIIFDATLENINIGIALLFNKVKNSRNTINHFGYGLKRSDSPKSYLDLETDLNQLFNEFKRLS